MKDFTGFWTFFLNPKIWDIVSFLKSNEDETRYQIMKNQKEAFVKGQWGVIRVGNDDRNKAMRNSTPKLQRGIYAFVEILEEAAPNLNNTDKFNYPMKSSDISRHTVPIRFHKQLLKEPLYIEDLKYDPIIQKDPLLLNGFQASCMPLMEEVYKRLRALAK